MEQSLPLRDIHPPEAISSWPPAIGWWLLLIIVPVLIFSSWMLYKRLTRKTAITSAKALLLEIKADQSTDDLKKLQHISIWLRRVTISIDPRQHSAGLTGQAWLEYLDGDLDGQPFSQGVGCCLADAQFRQSAPEDLDIPALIKLCELWLKGQKL